MTTKPSSAGAAGSLGDTPGRGVPGRSLQSDHAPEDCGLASHPHPIHPSRESGPGWSWGRAGVTYASWAFWLRLYFFMTSWNRPMGAEAGGLSGGTVDLEGAGQE